MDSKTLSTLDNLIGDAPVSEQISVALEHVAPKNHTHDNYADYDEVEELKQKVEKLINLVGDVSVAEQINIAIHNRI